MLKKLADIATKLDQMGWTKEADFLDSVITKLAQPVSTGIAGAEYEKGVQTTPGYPGGQKMKWYASKPKSLSEFNKFLSAVIQANPKAFSDDVYQAAVSLSNSSEWSDQTNAAFKEFAIAIGKPEAGDSWIKFAKENGYEPNLNGIYAFWEKYAPGLKAGKGGADGGQEARRKEKTPTELLAKYNDENHTTSKVNQDALNAFVSRVHNQITGGTGFSFSNGSVSTLHGKVKNALMSLKTEGAVNWFNNPVNSTLPLERIKEGNLSVWIMGFISNQEIISVYSLIDEVAKKAEKQ